LLLVLAFAIRGLSRGLIAQIFGFLGMVAGLWTAGLVSQWVGAQWLGAQPAVAFFVLRCLVTLTAALAAAAIFHWWGQLLHGAAKATAFLWLDRSGGLLMGGALGTVVVTFMLLGALLTPWPRALEKAAAASVAAHPAMTGGARVCSLASRYFPGSTWLRQQFLVAERRAGRGRAS
jgi:membrane protein required for colicin V production